MLPPQWLALAENELLLFAGVFFLLGSLDELLVEVAWLWLRLSGRARTWRIDREQLQERSLSGPAALLILTWHEDKVIEHTIAHALLAWPQAELRLYAGCYRNDPLTFDAISRGAGGDPRVRVVVVEHDGPTTKADCLNRLYAAVEADERRTGEEVRMVLLHDDEDMVDPAALGLMDRGMDDADFIQLPVLPEAQASSRWIGSHYCEEFAEAHGKAMVVREALGAALPAAGVGCGFSRPMLRTLAAQMHLERGEAGPFSVESLTEDYELGLRIKAAGFRSRFLRVRGQDGRLVATRACFPARIDQSVKQKARWIHGIALQGWDRMGWSGGLPERWMRIRDRRGPMTALVLFVGYLLIVVGSPLLLAGQLGLARPWQPDPFLVLILWFNLASFIWRAVMRAGFTAREYGWVEGLRAVLRIPVTNIIAMMAARRGLGAYMLTLRGGPIKWEKTSHHALPATLLAPRPA